MSCSPLIELRNLSRSFKVGENEIHALSGVNLSVYPGDSLAIVGPSGSGKSTLMHLLGCLDSPTSGHYFFNSEDVSHLDDNSLSKIRATQIGFVFQSFNLIPQLNVLENVEVPFFYQSKKGKEIAVKSLIDVGLGHRIYHFPALLSGGEMQRVAIARALATDPLLILADEPTGNLDSENGKSILNLFSELQRQKKTLIIVTHDPFVANHCQRIVRMQDGRLFEEKR